jgi:hypothetical protein
VTEESAQGLFLFCPNYNVFTSEAVMETSGLEIIRLELKYCERCGGLWVRTQDSGDVYCPFCVTDMLDLPIPREKRKSLPPSDGIEIEGQCEEWANPFSERGNA